MSARARSEGRGPPARRVWAFDARGARLHAPLAPAAGARRVRCPRSPDGAAEAAAAGDWRARRQPRPAKLRGTPGGAWRRAARGSQLAPDATRCSRAGLAPLDEHPSGSSPAAHRGRTLWD